MRDSERDSRRHLRPTSQHQELENLLDKFRHLQLGDDSELLELVPPHNTRHLRVDLPTLADLKIEPFFADPSLSSPLIFNHSDWSDPLSPNTAPSDDPALIQENLPEFLTNQGSNSDRIPGAYTYTFYASSRRIRRDNTIYFPVFLTINPPHKNRVFLIVTHRTLISVIVPILILPPSALRRSFPLP